MPTGLFPRGYKKFEDVKLMLVMLMPAKLHKCTKCCILDCQLDNNFAKKIFVTCDQGY